MANTRISTSELDFDQIKTNLKTYLGGQPEFQDYDFEGSGMAILLDVLAYNTHYNALYTNLAVNESFLDSASKRSSVVSLAKQLGYVPQSATASTAIVNVVLSSPTSTPALLALPKHTLFVSSVNNTNYNFYTTEDIVTTYGIPTAGKYTFENVAITEGTPLSFRYVVSEGQQYFIPNVNVDLSTLKIQVQESALSSVYNTYNKGDNILGITATSKVFFIKEIENQKYQIEFGNGVIGQALENGNVVHIEYFVTNASYANNARVFNYQGSTILGGIISTPTVAAATGGTEIEGIDSIKYNAPRHFSAQNRGVTVEDYKNLILSNYPAAQAVNVWGGENNNPPVYGKVFICVKPNGALALAPDEKATVKGILSNRNVVSIVPELVDPNYIYIEVTSSVYYTTRDTIRTADDIKTLVTQTIKDFNTSDLQQFNSVFRQSKLSRLIDATEPAIVSNVTTIKLHRRILPFYDVASQYTINLVNPIYSSGAAEEAIITSGFYVLGSSVLHYIDDDGVGNLRLFTYNGTYKNFVNSKVGTVNYTKGIIDVVDLHITGLDLNSTYEELSFIIKPQSYDAVSVRDQLVTIPDDHINVTVIVDKFAGNDPEGGLNYVFSSSRS